MPENILLRFVRMVSCIFKTGVGGEDSSRGKVPSIASDRNPKRTLIKEVDGH